MSPPAEDPPTEREAEHARPGPASRPSAEGLAAPSSPLGARPRSEGFPKACRLRRRSEFLRIQGQGQRIHGRRLIFQFLPGATAECRLGITVSKKVGNSVVRSRIKRWVREAFRRHPELRPRRDDGARRRPYDLVITAKRDVTDFSWQAIHDELVHVLKRHLDERERRGRTERVERAERGAGKPAAPRARRDDGDR